MAMELDHSFTVPVPPDQAWDVLLDVKRVAPCMPGATVDSVEGDDVAGRLKVKVGPVSLTYKGTAKFTDRDPDTRSILVEASGKETRGSGTASATVKAALSPYESAESNGDGAGSDDQTLVTIHTTLNVTGRPAQFGRGVIAEVGSRLIDKFADNLAQQLASGSPRAGVSRLRFPRRLTGRSRRCRLTGRRGIAQHARDRRRARRSAAGRRLVCPGRDPRAHIPGRARAAGYAAGPGAGAGRPPRPAEHRRPGHREAARPGRRRRGRGRPAHLGRPPHLPPPQVRLSRPSASPRAGSP